MYVLLLLQFESLVKCKMYPKSTPVLVIEEECAANVRANAVNESRGAAFRMRRPAVDIVDTHQMGCCPEIMGLVPLLKGGFWSLSLLVVEHFDPSK